MLILAIDTSCASAQVALCENGIVLCELTLQDRNTHSVKLLPMIEQLFTLSGKTLAQVEGIAVITGPGSFTGLRIGAATAKMLAFPHNIPLMGVNTLDFLAASAGIGEGCFICPILDARNETVYYSLYEGRTQKIPYRAENLRTVCQQIRKDYPGRKVWFCGDGTLRYEKLLQEEMGECYALVPAEQRLGRASTIARLAWERWQAGDRGNTAEELEIYYLRKPQAERLREDQQA